MLVSITTFSKLPCPRDMLVLSSGKHRVHSVSHFVKKIINHSSIQKCRSGPRGGWQIQHHNNNWVLIVFIFSHSATTYCKMTVLYWFNIQISLLKLDQWNRCIFRIVNTNYGYVYYLKWLIFATKEITINMSH